MGTSLSQPSLPTPLLVSESRAKTAKATLRKPENPHEEMGKVVAAVRDLSRLNLDEFAAELKKDPRQVKRWESGDERPQIEAVWVVMRFKPLVVEAMARIANTPIEVETVIRIRRSA